MITHFKGREVELKESMRSTQHSSLSVLNVSNSLLPGFPSCYLDAILSVYLVICVFEKTPTLLSVPES